MSKQSEQLRKIRNTAWGLVGFVCMMGGFAFYSPELYDLFCRVTGYGGTPVMVAGSKTMPSLSSSSRSFEVRFDSDISEKLAWEFEPAQSSVRLKAGEVVVVHYRAQNKLANVSTGTAVYNVTPHKVAPYIAKVECFCFQEQTLAAGEEAMMPIRFTIDPALFADPTMNDIEVITFSYVFYPHGSAPETGMSHDMDMTSGT